MKAGMVTFSIKDGAMDNFVEKVEQSIEDSENVSGRGPVYLITEPGSNICMVFGLWDTAEEAAKFEKNADFIRFKNEIRPLLESDPVRRVYDVLTYSVEQGKQAA